MSEPQREGERGGSFKDQWMRLSPDLKTILPEGNLSYLETTDKMHCGPGEGGSKFNDPRIDSILDVVGMKEGLTESIAARTDDREALKAAGAPENAFLPSVKGPDAPPGLPEALYFKVEGVEGRLGIIKVGELPPETQVLIRREKGKSDPSDRKTYAPVSFTVIRGTVEDMPKTDFATVIVGRDGGNDSADAVWTVHPGAPIRPAGGEFPFTSGLLGPDEVPEGEKQPARIMTIAELKAQANLGENDFVKIIPGNLAETASKYQLAETEGKQEAGKEKSMEARLESIKGANTLAIDIPFEAVQSMKTELETKLGVPLKDRGEAHITLIRPTDAKILREGLVSTEDLQAFEDCVGTPVEVAGIGTIPPNLDAEGVKAFMAEEAEQAAKDPKFKPKGVVFFGVVKLPEGIQAKLDALIDKVNASQPDPKKHATKVNPHVTIGFTLKDRFDGSKAIINPNFDAPTDEIQYESVVAQKPVLDAEGKQTKGPDGNPVSKYEAV